MRFVACLQFPRKCLAAVSRRGISRAVSGAGCQTHFLYQFQCPYLIWLSCYLCIEIPSPLQFYVNKVKASKQGNHRVFIRGVFTFFMNRKRKITNISNWQMWKRVNETESWQSHSLRLALCWNTLPEDRGRESRESMQEGGRGVGMAT